MAIEDPIVEEVRATRKAIEAAANNDYTVLYAEMIELQKQYTLRLITTPLPLEAIDLPTRYGHTPDKTGDEK